MITTIFAWWVVVSIGFTVGYMGVVTLWRAAAAVPRERAVLVQDAELDELEAWWARCEDARRVS